MIKEKVMAKARQGLATCRLSLSRMTRMVGRDGLVGYDVDFGIGGREVES